MLRKAWVIGFYVAQLLALGAGLYWLVLWPFLAAPLILAYSFMALGVVTSDVLTPSLSVVATELVGVSERVAGLTLLALGNSMPDITSTYQAMEANATTLALGELVGAVVFMLTVVTGTMAFVRTIDLRNGVGMSAVGPGTVLWYSRSRLVKDLAMFASMVSLALFLLCDGRLVLWECVVMVVAYVMYILSQVLGGEHATTLGNAPEDEETALLISPSSTRPDEDLFLQQLDLNKIVFREKLQRHLRRNYSRRLTLSLDSILNVWDNPDLFEIEPTAKNTSSKTRITRSRSNREFAYSVAPPSRPEITVTAAPDVPTPEAANPNSLRPLLRTYSRSASADYLLYLNNRIQSTTSSLSDQNSDHGSQDLQSVHNSINSRESPASILDKPVIQSTLRRYWNGNSDVTAMGLVELFTALLVSPIVAGLRVLIPASCNATDRTKRAFNVELVQVSVIPFVWCYALTHSIYVVATLLFSGILTSVLWYLNRNRYCDSAVRYLCVLSFLTCLGLISLTVQGVIATLQRCAHSLRLSEAMLGLTVFAWGNSIGDLVTTITFTKMGVLDIALGACFGGPLLYFVFGVGFDGILVMLSRPAKEGPFWYRSIEFEVDRLLIQSCISMLVTFLVYAALIPLNNWQIDRKIGVVLLTLYMCTTAVNVWSELQMVR
ncbi:Ycx1p LALA0_S04e06106g [Lachancea lanzarotensis]|uniref:LALA0S04e06106g1_1 n=1 Tax=Lachancea lanzarotensis TaxID=1245769 RepID=A0A0C7N9G4_9SACH|nr:uncharacterized protein LALA0_S04e06106g [Lachancea lanzarotensis]CEP62028.1 LALA0S04e06106g1_1 [Lachancea lanzarotensis]